MGRFYEGFVDTQYAIGDMVRVVDDIAYIENDVNHIGAISKTMATMGGKEFVVSKFVTRCDHRIVFDGTYYWLDDWLEPAASIQISESAFDDLFE